MFHLMGSIMGAGMLGSGYQASLQRQLAQQQVDMNMQQARWNQPGGFIPVDSLQQILAAPPKPPIFYIHTCTYCGRQAKKIDYEYGCTGCAGKEWK